MEGRSRGLVIGAAIRTVRVHQILGRLLFSDEAERGEAGRNGGLLEAAGAPAVRRVGPAQGELFDASGLLQGGGVRVRRVADDRFRLLQAARQARSGS